MMCSPNLQIEWEIHYSPLTFVPKWHLKRGRDQHKNMATKKGVQMMTGLELRPQKNLTHDARLSFETVFSVLHIKFQSLLLYCSSMWHTHILLLHLEVISENVIRHLSQLRTVKIVYVYYIVYTIPYTQIKTTMARAKIRCISGNHPSHECSSW